MTREPPSAHPHSDDIAGNGVKAQRLASLDAFRGFIMMTLAAGGFGFVRTARGLGYWPGAETETVAGRVWNGLAFHTSHPQWNSQFYVVGCSYWDLVMPAFMLMVGVAMPYSYASRRARGDSQWKLAGHAAWRALVLVLLGMFLQTRNGGGWERLLTNVLSQMGLGYFFVFLLLGRGFRLQLAAAVAILVGYWTLMVWWPVPAPLPDTASAGIEELTPAVPSLAPHFAKHSDEGAAFDRWLLGTANPGGFGTINFIPATVTMLLGVMAGQLLRESRSDREKLYGLLVGGAVCMVVAVVAGFTVCPVVKRIWSPSFTLFTGAWVLWMLAGFYWLIDVRSWKWWTFPLVVIGVNSLAIYLMEMLIRKWTAERLHVYLGETMFAGPYGPTIEAVCVLAVFWLACWYMYRNKIFLRI